MDHYDFEEAEAMKAGVEKQYQITKSLGLSQASQLWISGEDMPDSTPSKPSRPYKQVDLVFACVNKLIDAIAGIPPVISTAGDRIVESGPVYDLLLRNPAMSWTKFVTDTIGHYALSRDVFFIFTETEGVRPKEILIVSGTQMHPITHNRQASGALLGWEFRGTDGERTTFSLNEVHQWDNFNPYDRFHGLGPATASKLSIDYSFAASLYAASSLDNAAEPGAMLLADGKLDDDQVRMLRNQFDARHKGAGNAKRTAVLSGIKDVKTVAMTMANMQVAKISQMSDNKICSTFGVPPACVGLVTEAQYSQGPAQRDFVFNTVIPLCKLFAGELNTGILSKHYNSEQRSVKAADSSFYRDLNIKLHKKKCYRDARFKATAENQSLFLWFDIDQHPTVQDYTRETAEKVLKFTEAGVVLNDIIRAHDLPYEEHPHGEHHWVGMGQVPTDYILEAGVEGITGPSLPEGEEEDEDKKTISEKDIDFIVTKDDEARKLRIWQGWVASWAGIEREFNAATRRFFLNQQRTLTTKLKTVLNQFGEGKAVTKDSTDDIVARVVLDLKKENGKIRVINMTFFDKASELGIRQGVSEISSISKEQMDELVEMVKQKPSVKAKLTISTSKITEINKTTQKLVAKQIREGLEKGEGLGKLTERIKQATGKSLGRAKSIARTQTAQGVGTGRHEGLKAAGLELKSWLDSKDKHVRSSHKQAAANYKDGIPIDQAFEVAGEYLMYPADPSGSAANIINCRCVEIAIAAKSKSFGIKYYDKIKFYSYQDMQKDWELKKQIREEDENA